MPDRYLTDGQRLFQVISRFIADDSVGFASLEDCHTLEVRAYTLGELSTLGLRAVAPGAV